MIKEIKEGLPQQIVRRALALGFTKKGLAKRLNLTAQTMNTFQDAKDCSVSRLKSYSKVLNYNYFTEIAEELDIPEPKLKLVEEKDAQISLLEKEIEKLKYEQALKDKEIEVLNRSIRALGKG